jgi:hypothetical protein
MPDVWADAALECAAFSDSGSPVTPLAATRMLRFVYFVALREMNGIGLKDKARNPVQEIGEELFEARPRAVVVSPRSRHEATSFATSGWE